MTATTPVLSVSCGDPAGIGLETDASGVTAADGEHRGRGGHAGASPVMQPWM